METTTSTGAKKKQDLLVSESSIFLKTISINKFCR